MAKSKIKTMSGEERLRVFDEAAGEFAASCSKTLPFKAALQIGEELKKLRDFVRTVVADADGEPTYLGSGGIAMSDRRYLRDHTRLGARFDIETPMEQFVFEPDGKSFLLDRKAINYLRSHPSDGLTFREAVKRSREPASVNKRPKKGGVKHYRGVALARRRLSCALKGEA